MHRFSTLAVAVFVLAFMTGCESDALTEADSSIEPHSEVLLGKKPDHAGGGNGDGGGDDGGAGDTTPVAAALIDSGTNWTNAEGGRIGSDLHVAFDLVFDGTEYVRDETTAAANSSCPGWKFGLFEVLEKGGQTSDIIVRAYDGNGNNLNSAKVSIAPQTVSAEAYESVIVDRNVDMRSGRGKNGPVECTVYVGTIDYSAPPGS